MRHGADRLALVLRPGEGAARTAARIDALGGWRAAVVPLTAREPTGAAPPPGTFDAIVLTSAAAVPALDALPPAVRALPLHAIGEATAEAARMAGHAHVVVGADGAAPHDGRAFGQMLAGRGLRFLYPCAEARSPDLEAVLEARAAIAPWPVYRTVPRAGASAELLALDGAPAAVLLHAPSAARALGALCEATPAFAERMAGAAMLCLSARVGDALPGDLGAARHVARQPDDASLVALLSGLARDA